MRQNGIKAKKLFFSVVAACGIAFVVSLFPATSRYSGKVLDGIPKANANLSGQSPEGAPPERQTEGDKSYLATGVYAFAGLLYTGGARDLGKEMQVRALCIEKGWSLIHYDCEDEKAGFQLAKAVWDFYNFGGGNKMPGIHLETMPVSTKSYFVSVTPAAETQLRNYLLSKGYRSDVRFAQ